MRKRLLLLFVFYPFLSHAFEWRKTAHALSLKSGDKVIWTHVHDSGEAKPYFHPLNTPAGVLLSELKPKDHLWHRGLWFSWKFINGVNYWEEKNGRSDGTTKIQSVKVKTRDDFSAQIIMEIDYFQNPQKILLKEKRIIEISTPKDSSYTISWGATFTAQEKILLDRTPTPGQQGGKSYGGYAGLSLRASLDLKKSKDWAFVSENGQMIKHGERARHVSFKGNKAGLTIFTEGAELHKWYLNKGMPYFSPAILFENALTLGKNKKIELSYKIKIEDILEK